MHYFICFIISIIILLWAVARGTYLKINALLLILITVIGDGGYYALIHSENLEKAILANDLTYVIGIFAPMLIFFNICDACKIHLWKALEVCMYIVQLALYLCVCTSGKSDVFYNTIEYHQGIAGAYLTKTYGPMHAVYLITMVFYLIMSIVISFYSSRNRNLVSFKNIDIFILTSIMIGGSYMFERGLHLQVELMPFIFTIGLILILIPINKMSLFDIEKNQEIIRNNMRNIGYIVFTKNLSYMGCNDFAAELFPELRTWELEKKIPGNGGRFNTFLRQPFMSFVNADDNQIFAGKTFEIKEQRFHYEIRALHKGRKKTGYLIEIADVTNLL